MLNGIKPTVNFLWPTAKTHKLDYPKEQRGAIEQKLV